MEIKSIKVAKTIYRKPWERQTKCCKTRLGLREKKLKTKNYTLGKVKVFIKIRMSAIDSGTSGGHLFCKQKPIHDSSHKWYSALLRNAKVRSNQQNSD